MCQLLALVFILILALIMVIINIHLFTVLLWDVVIFLRVLVKQVRFICNTVCFELRVAGGFPPANSSSGPRVAGPRCEACYVK